MPTENATLHEVASKCPFIPRHTKHALFWIFSLLAIIGIAGNTFSIYLLSGQKQRRKKILSDVYRIFIIALAVADNGMLFFTGFLRYTIIAWMYESSQSWWVYEVYLCRWHRFVMHSFHNASVWLLVVMAFDRFLAVCFPFTYRELNHNSINAKKITASVFVMSCSLATPFLAVGPIFSDEQEEDRLVKAVAHRSEEYVSMWEVSAGENLTDLHDKYSSNSQDDVITLNSTTSGYVYPKRLVRGCSLTAALNEQDAYVINVIFHILLAFLVPYFVLLVLNVAIFRKLHCARRDVTAGIESRHRMNRKITVMMLAVCCTFIVLWLPQALILMTSSDAHAHNCKSDEVIGALAALSGLTNSALNFFLYCMTVKKFRIQAVNTIRQTLRLKTEKPEMTVTSFRRNQATHFRQERSHQYTLNNESPISGVNCPGQVANYSPGLRSVWPESIPMKETNLCDDATCLTKDVTINSSVIKSSPTSPVVFWR